VSDKFFKIVNWEWKEALLENSQNAIMIYCWYSIETGAYLFLQVFLAMVANVGHKICSKGKNLGKQVEQS